MVFSCIQRGLQNKIVKLCYTNITQIAGVQSIELLRHFLLTSKVKEKMVI